MEGKGTRNPGIAVFGLGKPERRPPDADHFTGGRRLPAGVGLAGGLAVGQEPAEAGDDSGGRLGA